jgi:hypothetical protein
MLNGSRADPSWAQKYRLERLERQGFLIPAEKWARKFGDLVVKHRDTSGMLESIPLPLRESLGNA